MESSGEARGFDDDLHAQNVTGPITGGSHVADMRNRVSDFLDLRHEGIPAREVTLLDAPFFNGVTGYLRAVFEHDELRHLLSAAFIGVVASSVKHAARR